MATTESELNQDTNAFKQPEWQLNNYKNVPWVYNGYAVPSIPKTPAEWFSFTFPAQTKLYGCPFVELKQPMVSGFDAILPMDINIDFFAASLGGDKRFGHSVVYFEPELQFYFYDPRDQLYKATSPEKLQNLTRAMLIRCAQDMPKPINILKLFYNFRADEVTKKIVNRAKSFLAADETFFSPDSKTMRKVGPELPERLGRVFIESMLEKRDGSLLTLTQAYNLFCQLSLQKHLAPIKKATFKEMMKDMMKEAFGICLRNDVPDQNNKQQMGWKGVAVNLGGEIKAEAA